MRIGVIGLGYVGLPLALAFSRKFSGTVGFDINQEKIQLLKQGIDPNNEDYESEIKSTKLLFTDQESDLRGLDFFVVGVPTPVDVNHNPDLGPVLSATEIVARAIKATNKKGAVIVYESTVYPGVTEEICGPLIEKISGLKCGEDFKLGYSPERINPGDKEHSLEKITKVVSGQDVVTLELIADTYSKVVEAGVFKATSIRVAEAAKVIENTQRDLNIALMNELAIIFDRLNISTSEVLAAAGTKWNFLKFSPGLVGGHCIGVDPYYLTTKAEQVGYHPQVILAGRRINDSMGAFIAQRTVKLMINSGLAARGARVGVLGLSFKENVTDIRNSRVPDILKELREFGVDTLVHDPLADKRHAKHEYGVNLVGWEDLRDLDALILAVPHRDFLSRDTEQLLNTLKAGGAVIDVKSALDRSKIPDKIPYWSL
jgi:UDP-N-acetyl-D-glucosamine/UDP-N-acetyl-D-galactosamine dehydrogenase